MSTRTEHQAAGLNNWTPKIPFDLVILYEDAAARACATRLYHQLFSTLEGEYDFQGHWHAFDELWDPAVNAQAAQAAAAADMIIVSLCSGREVPPTMDNWVETWLRHKEDRPSALVTLVLEQASSAQSIWPVRSYLQTVARLAKMDFFFHSSEAVPNLPASIYAIRQRSDTITPALEESLLPRYAASPR